MEVVEKASSTLSRDERLSLLKKSSPEIVMVLNELSDTIAKLRQRIHDEEMDTHQGVSLLNVQLQLMQLYSCNLLFFLLLKAEVSLSPSPNPSPSSSLIPSSSLSRRQGRSVKGHPVVERLVSIRVKLEKIAPLQNKLKYVIEKMMRTANSGTIKHDDPLRFKANPNQMELNELEEDGTSSSTLPPSPSSPSHG